MVGRLKEFIGNIVYWILIGSMTMVFLCLMLIYTILDMLMEISSKVTRSINTKT